MCKINGTKGRNLISEKDQGSVNIEAEKADPNVLEVKLTVNNEQLAGSKQVAEIQEEI